MLKVAGDHSVREQTCHITMDEQEAASHAGCYICAAFVREYNVEPETKSAELVLCWRLLEADLLEVTVKSEPKNETYESVVKGVNFVFEEFHPNTQDVEAALSPIERYRPPIDTSDLATHRLVAEWLRRCVENHPGCRQVRKSNYLPPRLLDLAQEKPRLVETKTLTEHQEYASLSHCWGKSPTFMRLSADNYERFLSGFASDELAKTFQDAIVLCKNLGIRYIWIDSLCIRQHGNGSQEDWQRHVAAMPNIYQSALLNIAAEWATSTKDGLFRKRDSLILDQPIITVSNGHSYSVQILATMGLSWNLNEAPLQKRGWVMQERILSPRIVHFTENQLCWGMLPLGRCLREMARRQPRH
jgi:hypothetical protein